LAIRILAGDYQPDSGSIILRGIPVKFDHPEAALKQGIGFVHQIPMYVPNLSVTENLLLGFPFRKKRTGLIDWATEHAHAREVLTRVGVTIEPRSSFSDLGPG
jgi:ABC-type sugar transport system ATPase subunit